MPERYRPPESLYPFGANWLDLGGIRMHFLDEGPREAPPVLMLHGNPTWSFYYRNLVLRLRGRFRCIVPDHVGCGLSDKPDDSHYDYHLQRRIEDLTALLADLRLERPVTLIVHDWGGMIGCAWAVDHPESVARLVILNTAAFPIPQAKRLPFALWLARTAPGGFLVRGFNAFAGLAARIAFKKPVSADVRRAYTGPYDSWDHRIATLRFVQDIPLRPGDRGFERLTATEAGLARLASKPAMLAWGMRDFVFDELFLDCWRALLPGAEVHRFGDCGHYVLEDAGEPLLDAIDDFVSRQHAAVEHS